MTYDDNSTAIGALIDGLNAGDASAREALLECSRERLRRLARKMLRGFPRVARWEDTDDVVQNAMLRLDGALRAVVVPSSRDFFRLAAAEIRRELIDLARKYSGPDGLGSRHWTPLGGRDPDRPSAGFDEPPDSTQDPVRLAFWTDVHRGIEALPDADREVFDLYWYQGLTHGQAAIVLGVSERTFRRRWIGARVKLYEALGGQFPEN